MGNIAIVFLTFFGWVGGNVKNQVIEHLGEGVVFGLARGAGIASWVFKGLIVGGGGTPPQPTGEDACATIVGGLT